MTVSIALSATPFWPNAVAVESRPALDTLAADYVSALGADSSPQIERFLFGSMPITIFDEIFAGCSPERRGELLWLLHLSGYHGGRWLRGEIAAAQPDAPIVGFSIPPSQETFEGAVAQVEARLAALDGDDDSIVTAAREALFDRPAPNDGEEPIRGLADNFGYNLGYMLEILASPPEGVEASPRFGVTCDGLFDGNYVSPKLSVLPTLAKLQTEINGDSSSDPALVADLRPIQNGAEPRGRDVWSSGLSVQGFSQESYDQLLDVSSSFLETVQATALINVQAAADHDVDAARIGLVAEAAMILWLSSYTAGLIDGEGKIQLPTFVS